MTTNTRNGRPAPDRAHPGDPPGYQEDGAGAAPAATSEWMTSIDALLNQLAATQVSTPHAQTPPRLSRALLLLTAGGAGDKIAVHAKASLIDRFGCLPQNAAILAFDSANDPAAARSQRTRQPITLEPGEEFHLFDPVPLGGIKRYPDRHPALVARMGDNLARIFRHTVHGGAARERPQGLLYVVWHAPVIDRLLETTLRRLTARDESVHQELQPEPGVNIVIAGSTGGGQGSGSLIDLAYLVRENLRRRADLTDISKIVGLFVLPGAFPEVRNPNLELNTYAFFLELDALMQGNGFAAHYPGNLTVESVERPFDQILVVDGVDENGRSWRNHDDVCAPAGRAVTLLFASEVGRRESGIAINHEQSLREISADGFGAYLGTIGQAVLRFPASQVLEACAVRQAQAVVDALLADPPAPDQPEAAPAAQTVNLGQVRERLRHNRAGVPYDLRVEAPAGLDQSPAEEMPALARNYFGNVRQRRLIEDYFGQMRAVLADAIHDSERRLADQLQTLVAGGLLAPARQWLAAVQAEFHQHQQAIATQQQTLAQAIAQREVALESASIALGRAAESLFLGRPARTRAAVSTYLSEADRLVQLVFARRVEDSCAELVQHGLEWAEHQQQQLQSAQHLARQVRARLNKRAAELAHPIHSAHEISLAEAPLVDRLYATHRNTLEADVLAFLAEAGDPLTWAHATAETLAHTLLHLAAHAFTPILQITVEDVLHQHWPDRSPQQWLGLLQDLAAGAWNLDRSLLPAGGAGLPHQLILGVPDAGSTRFALGDQALVSTNDPERIVALRTVYGAPFDALKPAVLWKRAYTGAAGRVPLHVLPGFQSQDDRSTQLFALGLIFDYIQDRSNRFTYQPEDSLDDPIPLGHGQRNALLNFQQQKMLHVQVRTRIDAWIAAQGANHAWRKIDAYVGRAARDDLAKTLQRTARAYADDLRRNQQNGDAA